MKHRDNPVGLEWDCMLLYTKKWEDLWNWSIKHLALITLYSYKLIHAFSLTMSRLFYYFHSQHSSDSTETQRHSQLIECWRWGHEVC